MKILHVASFVGNIGDNASHMGFYRILDSFFHNYSVEKHEIRKYYKNYNHSDKRYFDGEFVRYVNTFDLLVIGGGGFLDYWVPDSSSGTTIDIEPKLLSKISVPTLFTSIGCFPHKNIPDGNIDKFRRFLDAALSNPKIRIAFRNDGSIESLKHDIGVEYSGRVSEVLDNGFFYATERDYVFPLRADYIAINITNDQIDMTSRIHNKINKDQYYKELSCIVTHIVRQLKMDVVFVPHIYSDLESISTLLKNIDDTVARNNVSVAPYVQGDDGANYIFTIYKQSAAVIATRLHANICSLAMGKATIGLAALDRVAHLHESVGSSSYAIPTDAFSAQVVEKLLRSHKNDAVLANIDRLKSSSLNVYKSFFEVLI